MIRTDLTEIAREHLELGLQELETLEAPGFWTGVGTGIIYSSALASVASAFAALT